MPTAKFRPQVNGFAFVNSWTFSLSENDTIIQTLGATANHLTGGLAGAAARVIAPVLQPTIQGWLARANPQTYGLCGGMAAAALDYYKARRPLPRGAGPTDWPTDATPQGAALRSYLLHRQIDSMVLNFPKLLFWMFMLHTDVPFTTDDGPRWLLRRTQAEWELLKRKIDEGNGDNDGDKQPWPLTLIGTSSSPFDNHQVLAYDYADTGDGTGTIFLYDMNCPGGEQTIKLNFRGPALAAEESCASAPRGPLHGFFCNEYKPVVPPV